MAGPDHLVISSRRYESDTLAYGPFSDLEAAQDFMLRLAKQVDDCPLDELEDNYHLETGMFYFDITTLNDPAEMEELWQSNK